MKEGGVRRPSAPIPWKSLTRFQRKKRERRPVHRWEEDIKARNKGAARNRYALHHTKLPAVYIALLARRRRGSRLGALQGDNIMRLEAGGTYEQKSRFATKSAAMTSHARGSSPVARRQRPPWPSAGEPAPVFFASAGEPVNCYSFQRHSSHIFEYELSLN